jgi:hypothetical protein
MFNANMCSSTALNLDYAHNTSPLFGWAVQVSWEFPLFSQQLPVNNACIKIFGFTQQCSHPNIYTYPIMQRVQEVTYFFLPDLASAGAFSSAAGAAGLASAAAGLFFLVSFPFPISWMFLERLKVKLSKLKFCGWVKRLWGKVPRKSGLT